MQKLILLLMLCGCAFANTSSSGVGTNTALPLTSNGNTYAYTDLDNGDSWIELQTCLIDNTGNVSECPGGQTINPEQQYLLSNFTGSLYKTLVSGADMAEYNNNIYIPYYTLDLTTITINAYGVLKCSHRESDGYLTCNSTYVESDLSNIKIAGLTINNGTAYISNLYKLPYRCAIDKNGDFILPCADNTNTSSYTPIELSINADASMAIGIDLNSNILSCSLNSQHDITACQKIVPESSPINHPQQIAFYKNYIYIADGNWSILNGQATIFKCVLNNNTSLACQTVFTQDQGVPYGTAFTGIIVNSIQDIAYITENSPQGYGALWSCPIQSDGTFVTSKCQVNKKLFGVVGKTVIPQ